MLGVTAMIGYTPIFSKIVDSSLWGESDVVVKVFLTLLAKKDGDNVVRGNAYNIAQWAKKTEQEVLEALRVLSSPDTRRVEPQPFQGRRIEKVDEGWRLLNGEFYQNLMREVNRRAYKAQKQREYRARRAIAEVRPSNGPVTLAESNYEKDFGDGKRTTDGVS